MESFTSQDLSRAGAAKHITGLEALRALAMTAVVAEHSRIFTFGWMGVWLFYVISGFVVTGALEARSHARVAAQVSVFWARRSARIMPAYYLWVVLAVLVSLVQRAPIDGRTLASLVLFFQNFALASGWGDLPGFNVGNLWTVSVEMQFYVLYGLAFVCAPRRVTIAALCALLVICPALRFWYGDSLAARGAAPLDAAFRVYSFSVLHFDAFAYGCLLSIGRRRLTPRGAARLLATSLALLALYAGAYVIVNFFHGAHGVSALKNVLSGILYGQHREALLYIPVDLTAMSLVALVVSNSRFDQRLSLPVLRHVGRISYGAYLYHGAMLALAAALIGRVLPSEGPARFLFRGAQFALGMALVTGLASLSYVWIERPVTRWVSRRLAAGRDQAPDGVAA